MKKKSTENCQQIKTYAKRFLGKISIFYVLSKTYKITIRGLNIRKRLNGPFNILR